MVTTVACQCSSSFALATSHLPFCVARMKYLPLQLLFAALILVCGIYCSCGPMRMKNVPNYKNIMEGKPKKVINVQSPHGVCVADNGMFAVVPYMTTKSFHLYYGCGKQMQVVSLPSERRGTKFIHCTFAGDNLYVTASNKEIYKFSMNGTFIKVMASGEGYGFITSCGNDMLYVTVGKSLIAYHNEKEEWRVEVPTNLAARQPTIGLDKNIHLTTRTNKVLFYSLEGKPLGSKEYEGLKSGDGIAIDAAGNTLVVARTGSQKLLVYSPCGKLIKTIQFDGPADVEIGYDGTIIVTDLTKNEVFLY